MPDRLSASLKRRLERAARAATRRAYAPYSAFRVGAAVLGTSGRIYSAGNVENASYGLSLCAERGAVQAAVAAGERKLRAVAIYTPTARPTAPCGACRQVLHEFGSGLEVIALCASRARLEAPLAELLPAAFGSRNPATKRSRAKPR